MRDDMHRVLVTRARLGGKIRRKGRARHAEETPSMVGMKRSHALTKVDMKMLNEYLQPLRRYLHAQVGRPWDKVWSESRRDYGCLRPSSSMCATMSSTSSPRTSR